MKKAVKLIIIITLMLSVKVYASTNDYIYVDTVRETTTENDGYDTIARDTTIIGVTKFTSGEVITAMKATKAGANDAMLYINSNGSATGYTDPKIYIYYGKVGGWYELDANNNSKEVTDKTLLNSLNSQNIYYVNNKEKLIQINYIYDNLKDNQTGVVVNGSKVYVRSTLKTINIKDRDSENEKFTFDESEGYYISEFDTNRCKYNGILNNETKFVSGQYTYIYNDGGWSVKLTDKNATTPVTTKICTTINNKPIISMDFMFANSKATSIDVSDFNTRNVTDMSYMFYKSKVLNLDLSNFNTSNVTNMQNMFEGAEALNLDLSSFNTSKVTSMFRMFDDTKALGLDLSNFDTSKVSNMYGMFFSSAATEIKGLNKFNTSKVSLMSYMFYQSKVKQLDLSSFDTSNVTEMSSMFCNSVATEIIGLNKFNTSKVTKMSRMFDDTKALSLDLSGFDTSNVTDMSWMFYNSAAAEIKGLNKFNTAKVTNMSFMFGSSKALSLDLNNFNTSKVTDMSGIFYNSTATEIKGLNKFNTSKVTNMLDMFYKSKALNLDLNSFDTSNVTDMSRMFSNTKVSTLDLSSFDTSNVTNMNSMFASSTATTGYARTEADADRFNLSSNKPSGLTFVIKTT